MFYQDFLNLDEIKSKSIVKKYQKSKNNILVIGGLGYIGSHLVKDLLDRGEKVSVIDCCLLDLMFLINFQNIKILNL